MLNTYIKNRGSTQMLIHENNRNQFNEIKWDADYDGDVANISLTADVDGNKKHFYITLDNQDLAKILNVPTVNIPLEKRLEMDFEKPINQNVFQIELPPDNSVKSTNYLSSPSENEELIIPISIDKYNLPHKKHKKTHKTYRVYKKRKTHSSKKSKTKSKTKSKSTSKSFTLF
jgi:hypothetical protein